MDAARRARPDRRFRAALVRQDRDPRRAFHPVARHRAQQVLLLAPALRLSQRAQRLGSPRFLARRVGEAGHPRFLSPASAGRLPAVDVHDARRRHRGGQPVERLAGVEPGGAAAQVERQNVAERDGLPTAARAASTLAYRRFLHQHLGYVLLPVQRAGWLQPFDCALGLARGDEGGRHRDHSPSREGEIPGCQTAPHLRQRAAVPRQGLQGIHPYLGG